MSTSTKYNKNQKREQPRSRRREITTRGVMKDKIKKSVKCVKCKQATFYPVKCARCDEWYKRHPTEKFFMPFHKARVWIKPGTADPLCVDCISQDEYYGNVCGYCQVYLSSFSCNASCERVRLVYPCKSCTIPIGRGECEHKILYWRTHDWIRRRDEKIWHPFFSHISI